MGSITIVGLGCGDGRYLTREAWEVLANAAQPVWLRTAEHPAVADLPCAWRSFDDLYARAVDFPAVYAAIGTTLLEAAQHADVIYAVPGDPHVGEATTFALLDGARAAGLAVRVVRGLSFFEPLVAAVGLDGMDGVQIYDAIAVAQTLHPNLNPDAPLLLGQLYSRMLASDLKLALMAIYPPEHPVQLVHAAGSAAQRVEQCALHEIDHGAPLGNLTALYVPPRVTTSSLAGFADTIAILRSPDGCPWDRVQTPQSLRASLLEEVAEVIDALDRDDSAHLREELGDLLLHIVMQAQIASEGDEFTLSDVVAAIDAKIRRRHPHVWGDAQVQTVEDQNATWAAIKAAEKAQRGEAPSASVLDNIPLALPALARSQKIQARARKVGFEWPDIDGVYAKLAEELAEVRAAATPAERADELGDLLFVTVNLAKWLDVDAETALREANLKFDRRFRQMEQLLAADGITFDQLAIDGLEAYWQRAKRIVG